MFENSLDGKCARVTGAFGGLGRHFALTLARAAASVALVGRRKLAMARIAQLGQNQALPSPAGPA
jgi:NADP-dependent 3-hydroxy acid dehydrogenase YdfG